MAKECVERRTGIFETLEPERFKSLGVRVCAAPNVSRHRQGWAAFCDQLGSKHGIMECTMMHLAEGMIVDRLLVTCHDGVENGCTTATSDLVMSSQSEHQQMITFPLRPAVAASPQLCDHLESPTHASTPQFL